MAFMKDEWYRNRLVPPKYTPAQWDEMSFSERATALQQYSYVIDDFGLLQRIRAEIEYHVSVQTEIKRMTR